VLPEPIPGRKQPPCDLQPRLAEALLGGEPCEVGGQIPDQVRPADLARGGIEAAVGPAAIGADDPFEIPAKQGDRLALVAVGGDPEEGRPRSEGAPPGAPLAAHSPAGLVDLESGGLADALEQVLAGPHQRLSGASENRVHRAAREPGAKQLAGQLDRVAPGDAVADGECRNRRLQAGAEGAGGTSAVSE
jgi:hypothetical protein